MMLSMMISGPRQPKNDRCLSKSFDRRLEIVMGWRCWGFYAHEKANFNFRVMLFCMINDFPAYENLSGYSVKGHHACPICEQNTS